MKSAISHEPRLVPQVMVSSTFTNLKGHRAALINAIHKHKLHANVMEHDDAKVDGDVIDSSLRMVRDSAAYILLVSQKYGQVPECLLRNPNNLSITELEFDEAQRLGRPTLVFIMSEEHLVLPRDLEQDAEKKKKFKRFPQSSETGVAWRKSEPCLLRFRQSPGFQGQNRRASHTTCWDS